MVDHVVLLHDVVGHALAPVDVVDQGVVLLAVNEGHTLLHVGLVYSVGLRYVVVSSSENK